MRSEEGWPAGLGVWRGREERRAVLSACGGGRGLERDTGREEQLAKPPSFSAPRHRFLCLSFPPPLFSLVVVAKWVD